MNSPLTKAKISLKVTLILTVLATGLLFSACKKYKSTEPNDATSEEEVLKAKPHDGSDDFLEHCTGINRRTLHELLEAREATKRFRSLDKATKDEYVDAGIVIQNMGFHYLKAKLVSPKFDLRKPALLVYNQNAEGQFELVALEYAVPIDANKPFTPPAGFSGDADEWDRNTLNSGWWTLHAWVWKFNPDGVFKMMNPNVIVPGAEHMH